MEDQTGCSGAAALGLALTAPFIAPYCPRVTSGRPLKPPSTAHLLGTNNLAQDVCSRMLYGAQISLAVGVTSILLSTVLAPATALSLAVPGLNLLGDSIRDILDPRLR